MVNVFDETEKAFSDRLATISDAQWPLVGDNKPFAATVGRRLAYDVDWNESQRLGLSNGESQMATGRFEVEVYFPTGEGLLQFTQKVDAVATLFWFNKRGWTTDIGNYNLRVTKLPVPTGKFTVAKDLVRVVRVPFRIFVRD